MYVEMQMVGIVPWTAARTEPGRWGGITNCLILASDGCVHLTIGSWKRISQHVITPDEVPVAAHD